jgi:hypothetical protein
VLRLEELFEFLFPFRVPSANRRVCVIYGGYFDESIEGPAFSLAGYSASYATWVDLDWKWQDLCKNWKVEYFKASECENLLEQFSQYRDDPKSKAPLTPREHDIVVKIKTEFTDAICKHHDDLNGYGAVIIINDFKKIVAESAKAKRLFMGNPYYICAQCCLVQASMPIWTANQGLPRDDRVHLKPIFDSNEEHSGITKQIFDKFKKKNPKSAEFLLPLDYESDVDVSALQVADNLAYELRKYLGRQVSKGDDYMRPALARLKPGIKRTYRLDYDALSTMIRRQKPDSVPLKPNEIGQLWRKENENKKA